MSLTVGILRETVEGENRCALSPEVATKLEALGARVVAETGAGTAAGMPDGLFKSVEFLPANEVAAQSDVLLSVGRPDESALAGLKPGAVVIGMLRPYEADAFVAKARDAGITSFAMELVPRISRAQSMDTLSSQAAAAGYRAVLLGATELNKFLPMLTTAAGTIRPASALVIGAGVAGLQAIATARRLGAQVFGYDVRSATREQVESLGARFVDTGVKAEGEGGYARELTEEERAAQQAALADVIAKSDLVITTAAVPGRPAPRIIDAATVERMQPGAVIVDLAAEGGGNCELTRAGETVDHGGVKIVGPVNLPAGVARHASEMFARNLLNFLSPMVTDGKLAIDWEDEVYAESALTHDGAVRFGPAREALGEGEAS